MARHFLWSGLLIFVGVTAATAYLSSLGVDAHHDGILYKPALDVARGRLLFSESFTQYGALTTYLQAAIIKLFGEKLLVLKVMTSVVYGLIAVALYYASSFIMRWPYGALTVMLWFCAAPFHMWTLVPWSSIYALLMQMVSICMVLIYMRRQQEKYLFWAGLTAGFCFWFRQPAGILILSTLFFLPIFHNSMGLTWRQSLLKLRHIVIGFSLSTVLPLLFIWAQGSLRDWWLQSIGIAYQFAMESKSDHAWDAVSRLISSLFPTQPSTMIYVPHFWLVLPLIAIYFVVTKLWQAFSSQAMTSKDHALLFIALSAITSWHQYFPVLCIRHAFWAATIMLPLLVYTFLNVYSHLQYRTLKYPFLIMLITLTTGVVAHRLDESIRRIKQHRWTLVSPQRLSGIKVDDRELMDNWHRYGKLIEDIQNHWPNIGMIVSHMDALNLSHFSSENPSPVYVEWKLLERLYPERPEKIRSYIQKQQPLIEVPYDRKVSVGKYIEMKYGAGIEYIEVRRGSFRKLGITLAAPRIRASEIDKIIPL